MSPAERRHAQFFECNLLMCHAKQCLRVEKGVDVCVWLHRAYFAFPFFYYVGPLIQAIPDIEHSRTTTFPCLTLAIKLEIHNTYLAGCIQPKVLLLLDRRNGEQPAAVCPHHVRCCYFSFVVCVFHQLSKHHWPEHHSIKLHRKRRPHQHHPHWRVYMLNKIHRWQS